MGFDFLKRRKPESTEKPASASAPVQAPGGSSSASTADDRRVRVFTMGPSQEARWTRDLLASRGIDFQEVDASSDATLLSWIRSQTGSPEFPQIFLGRQLIGPFAIVRQLDLEGNLERLVAGEAAVEAGQDDDTPSGNSMEAVRARLRKGDVLSLTTPDGETFDTWAEVYANPPRVYYRGEPMPIESLDDVVDEIVPLLADPGTDASWGKGT